MTKRVGSDEHPAAKDAQMRKLQGANEGASAMFQAMVRCPKSEVYLTTSMLEASDKALDYLEHRVLDPAWVAEHCDAAYYFKAPMAFLLGGRHSEAERAFASLRKYLAADLSQSANAKYTAIDYPHYPLMWAARTAKMLGEDEAAAAWDAELVKWQAESGAGVTRCGDEDFFATAMLVFNALTFDRILEARRAADVLVRVADAQVERSVFNLRWNAKGAAIEKPASEDSLPEGFYTVDSAEPGQLYFMMAMAAIVLMELVEKMGGATPQNGAKRYVKAARDLVSFLSSCEGLATSMWAHKAALSAAMAGDRKTARSIGAFLLSQQCQHGGFMSEADHVDTVDQTAELASWLRLLAEHLTASD